MGYTSQIDKRVITKLSDFMISEKSEYSDRLNSYSLAFVTGPEILENTLLIKKSIERMIKVKGKQKVLTFYLDFSNLSPLNFPTFVNRMELELIETINEYANYDGINLVEQFKKILSNVYFPANLDILTTEAVINIVNDTSHMVVSKEKRKQLKKILLEDQNSKYKQFFSKRFEDIADVLIKSDNQNIEENKETMAKPSYLNFLNLVREICINKEIQFNVTSHDEIYRSGIEVNLIIKSF